jgi:hypothetical protein
MLPSVASPVTFESWNPLMSLFSHVGVVEPLRYLQSVTYSSYLHSREYRVSSFGNKYHMDLRALGGMSGGLVFIHRGLYWDFVGIVSQYHEDYDAMFFTSVHMVRLDGTIEPPPV